MDEKGQSEERREEEIEALKGAIDRTLAEERSILEEATRESFPSGERRVLETLGLVPPDRGRRWAPVLVVATLIAATVLAFVMLRTGDEPPPRGDSPVLGGDRVELTAPGATTDEWTAFAWRHVVEARTLPRVRVVVYAGEGPDGDPLATGSWTRDTSWTPRDTDEWPDTIYWELQAEEPRALLDSRVSRRSPR